MNQAPKKSYKIAKIWLGHRLGQILCQLIRRGIEFN